MELSFGRNCKGRSRVWYSCDPLLQKIRKHKTKVFPGCHTRGILYVCSLLDLDSYNLEITTHWLMDDNSTVTQKFYSDIKFQDEKERSSAYLFWRCQVLRGKRKIICLPVLTMSPCSASHCGIIRPVRNDTPMMVIFLVENSSQCWRTEKNPIES